MTLREYIYIYIYKEEGSVCQLGYIGGRSTCWPKGFRILIGADGSEGYFLLRSF